MKKKSLLTMALGLMLTMVVVVGGTLAYLSATETITNTFTVGKGYIEDEDHQGIWLDEEKIGTTTGERTEENQTYEDMMPGKTVVKDPTAYMVGGSVASYVFIRVEGVDEIEALQKEDKSGELVNCFTVQDWNIDDPATADEVEGDWLLVAADTEGGKDGYYLYVGSKYNHASLANVVDVSAEVEKSKCELSEIFGKVYMNNAVAVLPVNDEISKITVSAYAVQAADDMTNGYLDALAAIK